MTGELVQIAQELSSYNDQLLQLNEELIKNELEIICVFTQPPKRSNRGQKILKSPVQVIVELSASNVAPVAIFMSV